MEGSNGSGFLNAMGSWVSWAAGPGCCFSVGWHDWQRDLWAQEPYDFRGPSPSDLQGPVPCQIPGPGPWGLTLARVSWIHPCLHMPLFLKLLSFFVYSMALDCWAPWWPDASWMFWKDASCLLWREGRLPSTVCALSHCLFHFPLTSAQSILICSEDWACSPWTIDHHFLVILEVDLGFGSDIQPRGRTPA